MITQILLHVSALAHYTKILTPKLSHNSFESFHSRSSRSRPVFLIALLGRQCRTTFQILYDSIFPLFSAHGSTNLPHYVGGVSQIISALFVLILYFYKYRYQTRTSDVINEIYISDDGQI